MIRRQEDEEGAAIANLGVVPKGGADHGIAQKAATAKSRTKALARRLRKSSRMASLVAEVSEGIEQIAGYSDGIVESFEEARQLMDRIALESREVEQLRLTLPGVAAETRAASGEVVEALGKLSVEFIHREESLRGILSLIQGAAQTQNDIQKQVQELSQLKEAVNDLSVRLNRLLERADISGLNAVLEAGRTGDSAAGFGLVAAMARKAVAAFEPKAAEGASLLERMMEVHGNLYRKTAGAAERIQAIGVMTKGVRNAFTEAEGVIAELRIEAEEIADHTRNALEQLDEELPATKTVLQIAERAALSIDLATARLGNQEHRFAEVADHAEQVLSSTGRLASNDSLSGTLDSIYQDSDAFIRSIETTLELLDLSLAAIHDASHEMELLRTGSGTGLGKLEILFEAAEGTRKAAQMLRARTATLIGSLGAALAVLSDVARELALLGEESAAVGGEVSALRPLYRGISRLSGQAGAFAGRMDLLAVTGGVEAARAGEAGAGFAALSGEFEASATEASEVEQAASALCDQLDDRLHLMTGGLGKLDWRGLGESFDRLIAGMRDLRESHLALAEKKGAALADALEKLGASIEKVREKNTGMVQAAGEATVVIREARNYGDSQRTAFLQAIATAEKISALADELYPDEE